MKFFFNSVSVFFIFIFLTTLGCSHGYILAGKNQYNEQWSKGISQSIQESLSSGTTVTITKGDDRAIALSGTGFTIGTTYDLGVHDLDFEYAYYVYPNMNYSFKSFNSFTSGNSSGSTTATTDLTMQDVTYSHVGIGYGYKMEFITPVVLITKSGFSMTSLAFDSSGMGTLTYTTSNYFAWTGVKFELPLGSASVKLLIKGTAGIPLIKDKFVSSANVYDISTGLSW